MDSATLGGLIIAIVGTLVAIVALFIDMISIGRRIVIASGAIIFALLGILVAFDPWTVAGAAHGSAARPPLASPTVSVSPKIRTPLAQPVSNWAAFGPEVSGFDIKASGNNVTIHTPASYYDAMLGTFSVQGKVCNFDLRFDVNLRGGEGSAGFGYAVAPRANLNNGVPSGWSLQFEWDGTKRGYYYRHVILPNQATQPTDDFYFGSSNPGTLHWEIKGIGSQINVSLDGTQIPWDPSFPTSTCANGFAFRVWGGAATFSNITLQRAD